MCSLSPALPCFTLIQLHTLTPGSCLTLLLHFWIAFPSAGFLCVLSAYLHLSTSWTHVVFTDWQMGLLRMTECGILCPENSQSDTLRCQPATLCPQRWPHHCCSELESLSSSPCATNGQFLHDVIGAAIFHGVSLCSLTRVTQGQLDFPCSAKGQLKTCYQADTVSELLFIRVQQSQTSTIYRGQLWKAALTLLLKLFSFSFL